MILVVLDTSPLPNTWITDGRQLAQVVHIEPNGDLLVEDAKAPVSGPDEPRQTKRVLAAEWTRGDWHAVEPKGAHAPA